MPKVEGEKPTLKLGDAVQVEQVGLDGKVLSTGQMIVDEAGQPKVVARVGRIQVTETEFKLKPSQPIDVATDATQ